MTKQLELKRISDKEVEDAYGYDFAKDIRDIANRQLQADQQVLDNVKQAVIEDFIKEIEKSKMCYGWIKIKSDALLSIGI